MIQTIGPHKVQHGDVMDPDTISRLMAGEKADLVYSDPPWGKGNLNYWQTMNSKMNGVPRRTLDLDQFLDRVLTAIAEHASRYVLLEYGVGWRDQFLDLVGNYGLVHFDTVTPKYKAGSKMLDHDLHLFGVNGTPRTTIAPGTAQLHGIATVRNCVSPLAVEGGILLDPCCGLGLMAQVAAENKMRFRGNELNRKRLGKTIARLEKAVA